MPLCEIESDKNSKEYRKSWTRLSQKIYEVDPQTCPKCRGAIRFIGDPEGIKTILEKPGALDETKKTPKPYRAPINDSEYFCRIFPRSSGHTEEFGL